MNKRGNKRSHAACNQPVRIDGILNQLLNQSGLEHQVRILRICQHWQTAVGARIAARTRPISLKDGTLLVRAATAAWQNELTYLIPGILAKLNPLLSCDEQVRHIKIVATSVPFSAKDIEPPDLRPPKPLARHVEIAKNAAMPIQDDHLRRLFESVVTTYLSTRQNDT